MDFESGATEEYMVVSTRTKVSGSVPVEKAIRKNFDVLQKEFPRLNTKQTGPVIMIYRFKPDSSGAGPKDFELETAYPIQRGKLITVDPRSRLAIRELKKVKCAKYLFKGPVHEAPWEEFRKAVEGGGKMHIEETREIYRVFKGGGSPENEIEMQVILR